MRLSTLTIPAREDRGILALPVAGIYKTDTVAREFGMNAKFFKKSMLQYNVFRSFGLKETNIRNVSDNNNGFNYSFIGPSFFGAKIFGIDKIDIYSTYGDLEFDDDFKDKTDKGEILPDEVIEAYKFDGGDEEDTISDLSPVIKDCDKFIKKYPIRAGSNISALYSCCNRTSDKDCDTLYTILLIAVPKDRTNNSTIAVTATGSSDFDDAIKSAMHFVDYNMICNKTKYRIYKYVDKYTVKKDEIAVALSSVIYLSDHFVQYKIEG